jgi:hypothetical protein
MPIAEAGAAGGCCGGALAGVAAVRRLTVQQAR